MPISAELKLDAEVSVRKGINQKRLVADVWDGESQSEIRGVYKKNEADEKKLSLPR